MKKLFISLLTFLGLSISFSSALYTGDCASSTEFTVSENSYFILTNFSAGSSFTFGFYDKNNEYSLNITARSFTFRKDNVVVDGLLVLSPGTYTFDTYGTINSCLYSLIPIDCPTCPECPSCPSVNTGEILSGYILESSITSSYCEVEFGLIDPENCPASGGTGDINWSSFFVNSHQVQGAENIYLFLPDFLNWDYTYIDSGTTLNIEVENEGDTEYIQSVIDINSYRPTSEDFTSVFVNGLTLVMPYIVIVLFIIFIRKLIKKIFR